MDWAPQSTKANFLDSINLEEDGPLAALDQEVTRSDIVRLFEIVLGRPPSESDLFHVQAQHLSVETLLSHLRNAPELRQSIFGESGLAPPSKQRIPDQVYRSPDYLRTKSKSGAKILLIGHCSMDAWVGILCNYDKEVAIDRVMFNNFASPPDIGREKIEHYDFQLIQLPIRWIFTDPMLMGIKITDSAAQAAAFEEACSRLKWALSSATEYNQKYGLTTYVLNFPTPQQNPIGRALDRYNLSNPVFFIEELNRFLYSLCENEYKSVTVVDFDQIAANLGKRFALDDSVLQSNRLLFLTGLGNSTEDRIEDPGDVGQFYGPQQEKFIIAIYEEACGLHRSRIQEGAVKLVIFDLDDTLWSGVLAEQENVTQRDSVEGWPLGILECVSALWKRGILIALVSKNDPAIAERLWGELYGDIFPLENFFEHRIGWNAKALSVQAIISAACVLPSSVLFVDDNPVERAAVSKDVPGIRTLDAPLVEWRRILLWSAETQRIEMTAESTDRLESVRAIAKREQLSSLTSRDDFLTSLSVEVDQFIIESSDDSRMARCLELINKTNQFNTSGQRWTSASLDGFLTSGGRIFGFSVKDRYANYGITALALVEDELIRQVVMSCRVFGFEVERALIVLVLEDLRRRGKSFATALLVLNEKNGMTALFFEEAGFRDHDEGVWRRELAREFHVPAHIAVRLHQAEA